MMCFEVPKRGVVSPYVVLACALGWLSAGHAQEAHRDIPANAHYSSGEQGWVCNSGFRQVAEMCVEERDEVPSWSAFEVFDGQWRCRAGYHRAGSFCVPATAPAHATYVGNGERWECEWGYQKVAAHCEEIKPPAHAYVDASGHDWVCYPGFKRTADRCEQGASVAPAGDGKPTGSEGQK